MPPGRRAPRWLASGDWNAFFGLALDNTTQLVNWLRAAWGAGPASLAAPPPALALAIPWPTLSWVPAFGAVLPYLPLAAPFAIATVIGGIDNTESAIAAGDDYRTRDILLTEAVATAVAGLCGGVIQNTPYIGHPAYKAMGARAGYTLATALVIGVGGAVGAVSVLVSVLPEAAVAPILMRAAGAGIGLRRRRGTPAGAGPHPEPDARGALAAEQGEHLVVAPELELFDAG